VIALADMVAKATESFHADQQSDNDQGAQRADCLT